MDLSAYPDLVVIYLGMQVRAWRGLKTVLGLGPRIEAAGRERPDGLLHCDNNLIYSLRPLHVGMRWYWRDFESMERWARSGQHLAWWKQFLRDSGGTGFWHETYCMRGGAPGARARRHRSRRGSRKPRCTDVRGRPSLSLEHDRQGYPGHRRG